MPDADMAHHEPIAREEADDVPRTTTDPWRAHRAADEMSGMQLASSDDHQQVDHGIDILAVRSVRGDLERRPPAAVAPIHILNAGKEGHGAHHGVSREAR